MMLASRSFNIWSHPWQTAIEFGVRQTSFTNILVAFCPPKLISIRRTHSSKNAVEYSVSIFLTFQICRVSVNISYFHVPFHLSAAMSCQRSIPLMAVQIKALPFWSFVYFNFIFFACSLRARFSIHFGPIQWTKCREREKKKNVNVTSIYNFIACVCLSINGGCNKDNICTFHKFDECSSQKGNTSIKLNVYLMSRKVLKSFEMLLRSDGKLCSFAAIEMNILQYQFCCELAYKSLYCELCCEVAVGATATLIQNDRQVTVWIARTTTILAIGTQPHPRLLQCVWMAHEFANDSQPSRN